MIKVANHCKRGVDFSGSSKSLIYDSIGNGTLHIANVLLFISMMDDLAEISRLSIAGLNLQVAKYIRSVDRPSTN